MSNTFIKSVAEQKASRRYALAMQMLSMVGLSLVAGYTLHMDWEGTLIMLAILTSVMLVNLYPVISGFASGPVKHALIVDDDAILFRDGDAEYRLPYSCIKGMIVRGTFTQVRYVELKLGDLEDIVLRDYADMPLLFSLLHQHAPNAAIRVRGLLRFNKAFKTDLLQKK